MENVSASNKKTDGDLTQSAFDLLLARLDPNREEAGAQYELLRRKLLKFAGFWGSPSPEDLVDEAISRTARKIAEGEQIENLSAYTLRIAQFVHLEVIKRKVHQRNALKRNPAETPKQTSEWEDADEAAIRQRCYRRCLQALPAAERDLIIKYYGGEHTPDREKLSTALGKPLNSLRVAAFRIRKKLNSCLHDCLNHEGDVV